MKFCKEIYTRVDPEHANYKDVLITSKHDKLVWDEVFKDEINNILLYYLHLSTDPVNILKHQSHITYSQNRLSQTYTPYTSFQEFIDFQVSFQKIGASEYQKFTISMQTDLSFKQKMIDKYNMDTELKTLKNHLVYVVQLYVRRDMTDSFTTTEMEDIDLMMNAVPYFEYLTENRWTIEDIANGTIHDDKEYSAELGAFYKIEARALQQINRLFQ
jgi:hypothetical protein